MQTTFVGRHIDITQGIRQHADQKIAKLAKYDDLVIARGLTIGREAASKELFWAELNLSVRNHPEIVAKAEGHDVYALIDEAVAKAGRQLHDFKEVNKLEHR